MYSEFCTRAVLYAHRKALPLLAAMLTCTISLTAKPAAAVDIKDLVGDWSMPDSHETLTIRRNGNWYHPKYGRARIRRGNDASDVSVFYDGIETKCSYRVSIADGGNTLIFASADSRQDGDRCPTGQFKSVDR
jgi:hypothetical protein